MSSSSFWDRPDLSPKLLPTLQDVLRCCDADLMVRTLIGEHAKPAWGTDLPPKRRRAVERRLKATLEQMGALPVKRRAGRARVLVPAETFVLRLSDGLIERRVGAQMLSFDDAPAARRALEASSATAARDGRESPPEPVPLEYTLMPWEETLASRAWLKGPWCVRERYLALAAAVWEMTFYGFEYDRVVAAQMHARAAALAGRPAGCEGAPPARRASGAPVAERGTASSFGLVVPDPVEEAYRDRMIACVASLNRAARADTWKNLLDAARVLDAA